MPLDAEPRAADPVIVLLYFCAELEDVTRKIIKQEINEITEP